MTAAREEVASMLVRAAGEPRGEAVITLLAAVHRHLNVIDEEILKLRKELRTRNGGGENG